MLRFSGPHEEVGMDCFKTLKLPFDADATEKYKTTQDIQFLSQNSCSVVHELTRFYCAKLVNFFFLLVRNVPSLCVNFITPMLRGLVMY
jgi:hypothetical protein